MKDRIYCFFKAFLRPFESFVIKCKKLKVEKKYFKLIFSFLLTIFLIVSMGYLAYMILALVTQYIVEIMTIVGTIALLYNYYSERHKNDVEDVSSIDEVTYQQAEETARYVHPILAEAIYSTLFALRSQLPISEIFTSDDIEYHTPFMINDVSGYHFFKIMKKDTKIFLKDTELEHIKKLMQGHISEEISQGKFYGIRHCILFNKSRNHKDPVVIDKIQDIGNYILISVTFNNSDYEDHQTYLSMYSGTSYNRGNINSRNF